MIGQELLEKEKQMALIKCVECRKLISDRASACPNCGCPVGDMDREIISTENKVYQEIHELIKSSEPAVFKFGGLRFEYPEGTELYASIIGSFSIFMESTSQLANTMYNYAGDIREVLETIPEYCESIIESLMEFINNGLYAFDINLSLEEFLLKYSSKYELSYEKYYSQVVQAYAEICEEEEGLRRYREAVKASRGRWMGGGFGVKGAIKGAITAGMLNCASDFIHSFSDSKIERNDSEVIRRKLNELYRSDKAKVLLCGSFKKIVLNLYKAFMDEIKPVMGDCYSYDINYEKAKTLYDSTMKFEKDSTVIKENIAKCIYMYPADTRYIEAIMEDIRKEEENDLLAFIHFWQFDIYSEKFEVFEKIPEEAREQLPFLNFLKYCNEFSCLADSNEMNERKIIAQKFQKQRSKEQLDYSYNIRRRLSILCKSVNNQVYVVDKSLYRLSEKYITPIICEKEELDQYLFWMNSEIAVTDYYLYYGNKKVELSQLNEITVSVISGKMSYVAELKGGNSVKLFQTEDADIIDIILLLDIVLDPYRELGYESKLTAEIKPLYLKILNMNEKLKLDSDSDKEKKKKIADSIIKKNSDAIARQTKEKQSKKQIELAENLRRRFGKLLTIDQLEQSCIINKRVFELEAESKNIPSIISGFADIAHEYIFYAEDYLAITDYNIYIIIHDKNADQYVRYQYSLYEINEIIYRGAIITPNELYVYWKKEGEFARNHRDFVSFKVDHSCKPKGTMVVLLLNIALEPYADFGYYTHILHAVNCNSFFKLLSNYEKEYGTFENALDYNESDKKLLQTKKDIHEKFVLEELQKIRSNPSFCQETEEEQIFENKFTELFYEFCKVKDELPEYYGFLKNIYDFDIINYLPKQAKKYVLELKEKGQKILYVSESSPLVITNKCVLINHKEFNLLDLEEILVCKPLTVWDDDLVCLDRRTRIFVRMKEKNGLSTVCMICDETYFPMMDELNYAISIIKDLKDNLFRKEQLFICEECGSTDLEMTVGVLAKYKGNCRNCRNNLRKKIAVYVHDIYENDEKYRKITDNFLEHNKGLQQSLSKMWSRDRTVLKECVENEGKSVCCFCGKEIKKDSKFCNFCGQPVKLNSIDQEKRFCVYCGKEISREAKFCNFCGKANNIN